MPKFNDLELENWRDCDVNTDSLWLIQERTKTGKHKNVYHGNFIPQIPNQLIRRYTKKNEVVFEPEAALAGFPPLAADSHVVYDVGEILN